MELLLPVLFAVFFQLPAILIASQERDSFVCVLGFHESFEREHGRFFECLFRQVGAVYCFYRDGLIAFVVGHAQL